ncbi:MAG: hypothetical protein U0736_05320 [Gemmataceae bacterium]
MEDWPPQTATLPTIAEEPPPFEMPLTVALEFSRTDDPLLFALLLVSAIGLRYDVERALIAERDTEPVQSSEKE